MNRTAWINNFAYDNLLISFIWIPFLILFAYFLDIGNMAGKGFIDVNDFKIAVILTIVLNLIHRNYTFLLVYGDFNTFKERKKLFSITPVIVVITVVYFLYFANKTVYSLGLVIVFAWQIYHTVMQRYGILRVYHKKSNISSIALIKSKWMDLTFVWSYITFCFLISLILGYNLLKIHHYGKIFNSVIIYLDTSINIILILLAFLSITSLIYLIIINNKYKKPNTVLMPRNLFLLSTLLLGFIFVIYGPIIGFLTFSCLHTIEYIAFVYAFSKKRYQNKNSNSLSAKIFTSPKITILIFAIQLPIFYLLNNFVSLSGNVDYIKLYLLYNGILGLTHFIYDAFIWKVRDKKVSEVLQG